MSCFVRSFRWAVIVMGSFVLLVDGPCVHAQGYETVQQASISITSKLTGHVVVGIELEPLAGARVEICSSGWKQVLKSSQTDRNGDFLFDDPAANGKLFYVRVSAPGCDPYQLRVRVNKHAKSKLVIHLVIAT